MREFFCPFEAESKGCACEAEYYAQGGKLKRKFRAPLRRGGELDRGALPARAAAEEMGQSGGADDEGHEAQRDGLTLCVAGLKDHAHAVFTACSVPLIRPGHERSYQPQEGQEPGRVRVTDCAEIQQYPPENGVHRAYGYACRDGNCYENERLFHNFHLITAKSRCFRARRLPRAEVISSRRFRPAAEGDLIPCVHFLRNLAPVFM